VVPGCPTDLPLAFFLVGHRKRLSLGVNGPNKPRFIRPSDLDVGPLVGNIWAHDSSPCVTATRAAPTGRVV
jgi:hypothetical protein